MKINTQYDGWELQSFDEASNFRKYQMEKIKSFIKDKKILDVGSGNGGLIKYYQKETRKISVFEPSKNLNIELKKKFKKDKIMILIIRIKLDKSTM